MSDVLIKFDKERWTKRKLLRTARDKIEQGWFLVDNMEYHQISYALKTIMEQIDEEERKLYP